MKAEEIYSNLKDELYVPFIFYISSSLIPDDKKEIFNHPDIKGHLDKIWILGNDLKFLDLKSKPRLLDLMTRNEKLEQNMFKLFEAKETLNKLKFSYVLDKYHSQINFYVMVSKWLHDNVRKEIKDVDSATSGYFFIQKKLFLNHFNKLNELFYNQTKTTTNSINVFNHIENNIPSVKDFFKHTSTNTKKQNVVKKTTTKIKPVLITDDEARTYLLKTVFNVD